MHSPLAFRFATAAALIDREGYTGEEAEHLLREWNRYARYAMMIGKSPESTAEHLARFERHQRPNHARDGRSRSRFHRASPEDVDAAIAADLRRRAERIYMADPDHAREILAVARTVHVERDGRLDKPAMASAVLARASPVERDSLRRSDEYRISARGIPFRVCPRGTEIVSLIFPADFTERDVHAWTRVHGFKSKPLEFPRTTGSIRAPQRNPRDFEHGSFRTIVLSEQENIRAVIGCPRLGRESDKRSRRDPDDDDDDAVFRCSMCKGPLGGFSIMTADGRAVCSRRCKEAGIALAPGNPFATTEPRLQRPAVAAPPPQRSRKR